jgi:hypothetical protein
LPTKTDNSDKKTRTAAPAAGSAGQDRGADDPTAAGKRTGKPKAASGEAGKRKAAGGDAGKPKTAGQETAEPKATSGFDSNAEKAVTVGKCSKYRKVFAWSKHGGQAGAERAARDWADARRAETLA